MSRREPELPPGCVALERDGARWIADAARLEALVTGVLASALGAVLGIGAAVATTIFIILLVGVSFWLVASRRREYEL